MQAMNQFPCGSGISPFMPEQTAGEQIQGIELGSFGGLRIM
jgi:hypothetical protein